VYLEASTKPHVHQKFEIFWTNIASTMACPNFKNGPKIGLGPLGVTYKSLINIMGTINCLWNLYTSILKNHLQPKGRHWNLVNNDTEILLQ
jgi:hypothetical protein